VPANTTAIQIIVSTVTLDLGGFEVKGPNTCSNYPVTGCTATGGAAGILATSASAFLVTVRNGRVSGMAGSCVDLQGSSSVVEQVVAYLCGGTGIRVAPYGRVSDSVGLQNFGAGIAVGTGGAAHGNEVRGNSAIGVSVGAGVLGVSLTGNRALENGGAGISSGSSAVVTGNQVVGNAGDGITTGDGCSVQENTVSGNSGDGIEVGSHNTIIGNTIHSNVRCGLHAPDEASCPSCSSGWAHNVINANNGSPSNRQVYSALGSLVNLNTYTPDPTDPEAVHFFMNLCSDSAGERFGCPSRPANNCP
jgi:parallel beta-helix repeat protein